MPTAPVPLGAAVPERMVYGAFKYLPLHPHVLEDTFHQPLVSSKGQVLWENPGWVN